MRTNYPTVRSSFTRASKSPLQLVHPPANAHVRSPTLYAPRLLGCRDFRKRMHAMAYCTPHLWLLSTAAACTRADVHLRQETAVIHASMIRSAHLHRRLFEARVRGIHSSFLSTSNEVNCRTYLGKFRHCGVRPSSSHMHIMQEEDVPPAPCVCHGGDR